MCEHAISILFRWSVVELYDFLFIKKLNGDIKGRGDIKMGE